ncbi:MAG: hypothetical protein ACLSAQ_07660 [[Eubacterium] siraeum]
MPEADQEKRTAENYEITQAVRIGGKEVVFGMDETNAEPYFCAFYTANELFYEYSDCMVGDNFAEMMKLFGERIQQQAGKVLAEQEQASVPPCALNPRRLLSQQLFRMYRGENRGGQDQRPCPGIPHSKPPACVCYRR